MIQDEKHKNRGGAHLREEMHDPELIKRVQDHVPGAFEELYRTYVHKVVGCLRSMVGPSSDVDDLVQATFVQVFRNIGSYRSEARFTTWLHRVTVNVALMHLRSQRRWNEHEELDELDIPLDETPESRGERLDDLRSLYGILDRMKPKKRIIFVLYEVEGHTLEEISAIVAAPLNTVAARLRTARIEVRQAVADLRRREQEGVA
jgi:RNA polymerase sigma-70 factor, ECF subfamily